MKIRTLGAKLAVASFFGAAAISGSAFAADLSSGGDGGGGYKDGPPPAAYFVDDSIGFRYGTAFKEPGVNCGECQPGNAAGDIEKGVLEFIHFNTDKWGSNFLNIDTLFSTGKDPVEAHNGSGCCGTGGATEVYAVYRRYFSYGGVTGTNTSYGIIKDYGLNIGGDWNTKNDPFSAEKRSFVVGPQIVLSLWGGEVRAAVDYYAERNHNAFANLYQDFESFDIETGWRFPLKFTGAPLTFQGYANYIAPKGNQACYLYGPSFSHPTNCTTVGEFHTQAELMLDAGSYFGAAHKFDVGVGYEYWLNKFGNNAADLPGTIANTPMIIGRYHF
ncbi:MAG: hypothetical protein WBX25_27185 [Rhodomicrobium sp.]